MQKVKIAVAFLLALTWVLLTSHCRIEVLPGFEFLRCSTDVHESGDSGDPCKETECCSFESSQYQAPRQQEFALVVLVGIMPADRFSRAEPTRPDEVSRSLLPAAPPELSTSWRFSLRAALPVRAPSLAS